MHLSLICRILQYTGSNNFYNNYYRNGKGLGSTKIIPIFDCIKFIPRTVMQSVSAELATVVLLFNSLRAAGRYIGPTERTRCKAKVTFHGGTAAK